MGCRLGSERNVRELEMLKVSFENFSRGIAGETYTSYVSHSIEESALLRSSGRVDVIDNFSDEIG